MSQDNELPTVAFYRECKSENPDLGKIRGYVKNTKFFTNAQDKHRYTPLRKIMSDRKLETLFEELFPIMLERGLTINSSDIQIAAEYSSFHVFRILIETMHIPADYTYPITGAPLLQTVVNSIFDWEMQKQKIDYLVAKGAHFQKILEYMVKSSEQPIGIRLKDYSKEIGHLENIRLSNDALFAECESKKPRFAKIIEYLSSPSFYADTQNSRGSTILNVILHDKRLEVIFKHAFPILIKKGATIYETAICLAAAFSSFETFEAIYHEAKLSHNSVIANSPLTHIIVNSRNDWKEQKNKLKFLIDKGAPYKELIDYMRTNPKDFQKEILFVTKYTEPCSSDPL